MNREKQTLLCICLSIFKVLIIHPTNTRHNSSQKFSEGSGHFCPVAVFTSYVCYEWEERQHVNPCSYHLHQLSNVNAVTGQKRPINYSVLSNIQYEQLFQNGQNIYFVRGKKLCIFFYQRWGRMKKTFFFGTSHNNWTPFLVNNRLANLAVPILSRWKLIMVDMVSQFITKTWGFTTSTAMSKCKGRNHWYPTRAFEILFRMMQC